MRKLSYCRAALMMGIAVPFVPGMAMAQTAPAPDAPKSDAPKTVVDTPTGNDIIVTANRRPQTLLDVPLSVAAITGDAAAKMGIRQFNDLQSSVPNLQIDESNGNFVVSIRGQGSSSGNLAFEQSVGFFLDGVYSGRSRSMQTTMMDVDRVEVVRGPQGALFGKNTNAGAISVITNAPTRKFDASITGGYDVEQKGWNTDGHISGPITSNLSARFSYSVGKGGGYMYNRMTKEDEKSNDFLGLRAQLLFEPRPGMSARLKVEYGQNFYKGSNLALNGLGNCGVCNVARALAAPFGGIVETPAFVRASLPTGPEYSRTKNLNVTLTTETDLGGSFHLTTTSGYQKLNARSALDADVTPVNFLYNPHTEETTQLSQEVRVAGAIGILDLTVGGQYYYVKTHIIQNVVFNAAPYFPPPINVLYTGTSVLPFDQTSEALSPFVAADLNLLPGLTISGSLRYNWETKTARMQLLPGGNPPIYIPYDIRANRVESLWDYSGKASYKFGKNAQVYLSYATGSKGGGFVANDNNLGNPGTAFTYEPEIAKSWEAGVKLRGQDGLFDLNLALFSTKFTNLQVSSFNGISFTTGNAAKARSRGVEAELNIRPVSWFSIGGTAAYLDAKYQDFPKAGCLYNVPSPPCVTQNLSGYRLTRAPEWKWSGYAQVSAPVGNALELSGRAMVDYTGLTNYQDNQNPATMMPAYYKLDARIAIADKQQGWELALVGKNLTNKVSWSQAFAIPFFTGSAGVFVNPARTLTIQATKKF